MRRFLLFLIMLASVSALSVQIVQHDADVQTTYNDIKVCSCGSTTDVYTVKNLGDLEATFKFAIDSQKPWFSLDKTWEYLKPGQSTDVTVYINAPCDAKGNTAYTMQVSSEYGRYRAITKYVEAGVCENIQWSVEPLEASVEPCEKQDFKVQITNTGTFTENYQLEGLGSVPMTLNAGETGTLTQSYVASCSEWGEKTIPITLRASTNNRVDTKQLTINVPRDYDYQVSAGQPDAPVCKDELTAIPLTITNTESRDNTFTIQGEPWIEPTSIYVEGNDERTALVDFTPKKTGERTVEFTVTGGNGSITKRATSTVSVEACYGIKLLTPKDTEACTGASAIPFVITNTGTQEQTLIFDVQSDTTTQIKKLQQNIKPGEQITVPIIASIPDKDEKYYVTLFANDTLGEQQATANINGHSTESCYATIIENTHYRVWTDQDTLDIIVTSNGFESANYDVSTDGIFEPVEKSITLEPGKQTTLHLNTAGAIPGKTLSRLTLTSHGIDYTSDISIDVKEKGFIQHLQDACKYNSKFAVCGKVSSVSFILMVLVVLLVSGILIGVVQVDSPAINRNKIAIIGSLILILLLIGMMMNVPSIPRSYERDIKAPDTANLVYEIGEKQYLEVDMSALFQDPDSDSLQFSASKTDNLQIKVNGNNALIKPKARFHGQQTIVFTANDGKGGITDSDQITINVIALRPVTFLEYWQYACWFLTYMFLFITVGLALLSLLYMDQIRPARQYRRGLVLYRRPRTPARSKASELIEQPEKALSGIPPGTTIGQIIGTQIIQKEENKLFVASKEGTKFHQISCPIVKNMPKEKRLTFTTEEDAVKAGYTPCKTCQHG